MERKKKKLSADCQLDADGSEQETIQCLFSKKFVYSKGSQWSLKSTSVFGHFTEETGTGQGGNDHSIHTHSREVEAEDHRLSCHQQPQVPDGNTRSGFSAAEKPRNAPEAVESTKEPRITEQRSQEGSIGSPFPDVRQSETDLFPDGEKGGSKASPVRQGHHSHWSQKSPHFVGGSRAPFGNANKFRRKAVPAQRRLKRVRVVLPPPWQCDTLIGVKDELNALKDKLSDKEMIVWHQHTNSTNLAGQWRK